MGSFGGLSDCEGLVGVILTGGDGVVLGNITRKIVGMDSLALLTKIIIDAINT